MSDATGKNKQRAVTSPGMSKTDPFNIQMSSILLGSSMTRVAGMVALCRVTRPLSINKAG